MIKANLPYNSKSFNLLPLDVSSHNSYEALFNTLLMFVIIILNRYIMNHWNWSRKDEYVFSINF